MKKPLLNRILRILTLILAVIIVIYLGGLFLPAEYKIKRSIVIRKPAEVIFPYVDTLRYWRDWSVWSKKYDETFAAVYSGPAAGDGAVQNWYGDSFGSGVFTVTESVSNKKLSYVLSIDEETIMIWGSIRFHVRDGTTKIEWISNLEVEGNLFLRYFGYFLDGFIGPEIEKSLKGLKDFAERR